MYPTVEWRRLFGETDEQCHHLRGIPGLKSVHLACGPVLVFDAVPCDQCGGKSEINLSKSYSFDGEIDSEDGPCRACSGLGVVPEHGSIETRTEHRGDPIHQPPWSNNKFCEDCGRVTYQCDCTTEMGQYLVLVFLLDKETDDGA